MNDTYTAKTSVVNPALSLSDFELDQEAISTKRNQKIAYVMSRFPKLTETFILFEMLAMQQLGVQVELYPLLREKTSQFHPEAKEFIERAHFQPFFSWPILLAQLYYLFHKPVAYFSTLWTLLRSTWGSPNYFFGGLAIFPKSVYFARLMSKDQIEHIHAHFSNHPTAAAFIIHKLTGIPYSFVAHGSDLHRDRHMLYEKVAGAKFVAAISNFNRDIILSECGDKFKDKVILQHCGVDTSVFNKRQTSHVFESESPNFTVLCIGTLHEVKGQTFLIKACERLYREGLDIHCHFIGDGPDKEALIRQVNQAGLEKNVVFHGQLTRTAVVDMLQKADVLVAPSVPSQDGRREGIPVVLMEAMSCGIPVVASDLSGIPELVEHEETGLLTRPGDDIALAEAIHRLYIDPVLRQNLGEAGRTRIEQEFNLQRNAKKLAAMC